MTHPADAMLATLFDHAAGPWAERRRRELTIVAYRAGEKRLMREWPRDDEDGLASALGVLAAHLGY